jgi:thiol-disulfide isomerase/thioredoxin
MSWALWAAPWVVFLTVACTRDEPTKPAAPRDDGPAVVTAAELRAQVRAQKAKAVLVNAWATWCDSCQHELPMLQRLADAMAPQGVRVLLVSVDEPEERLQVRQFLADTGIRLPSYLAARPLEPFKAGMNPRWPGMLPASFLFDGSGKLRYFWGGEAFETEIVPIIEGLLAGKAIDGEARFGVLPEEPNRSAPK